MRTLIPGAVWRSGARIAGADRRTIDVEADLVIGAGIDGYNGYGQRGSFSIIEGTVAAIKELFPMFSRVRMNRQWGGIVDVCPDACPIISKLPVKGLYLDGGWCYGGFKAVPGSGFAFAHLIAQDPDAGPMGLASMMPEGGVPVRVAHPAGS